MYLFYGTSNSSLVLSFSNFLEWNSVEDVFETPVILSAILLSIKSPAASAVFELHFLKQFLLRPL